jgi:hypothetical protein
MVTSTQVGWDDVVTAQAVLRADALTRGEGGGSVASPPGGSSSASEQHAGALVPEEPSRAGARYFAQELASGVVQ